MAKNYTWHLTCETHGIDEPASCQTTGNDEVMSQAYIEDFARSIKAAYGCSRAFDNLVELIEERELE